MPYVDEEAKHEIQHTGQCAGPGDLNFIITNILIEYLNSHGESYQTHNDIIGVLDCAAREWYRRVVAPYEDQKCVTNGDVYFDPGHPLWLGPEPEKEGKRGRRRRKESR